MSAPLKAENAYSIRSPLNTRSILIFDSPHGYDADFLLRPFLATGQGSDHFILWEHAS